MKYKVPTPRAVINDNVTTEVLDETSENAPDFSNELIRAASFSQQRNFLTTRSSRERTEETLMNEINDSIKLLPELSRLIPIKVSSDTSNSETPYIRLS
jgi:hypothetical protein